ncbi:MAG: hypothetical protein HOG97_00005, partial [Candidatus Marinimicrobia bacterium]|nr:hypothetical protein [Candidatus Neomarinimicrobiota bacterium]
MTVLALPVANFTLYQTLPIVADKLLKYAEESLYDTGTHPGDIIVQTGHLALRALDIGSKANDIHEVKAALNEYELNSILNLELPRISEEEFKRAEAVQKEIEGFDYKWDTLETDVVKRKEIAVKQKDAATEGFEIFGVDGCEGIYIFQKVEDDWPHYYNSDKNLHLYHSLGAEHWNIGNVLKHDPPSTAYIRSAGGAIPTGKQEWSFWNGNAWVRGPDMTVIDVARDKVMKEHPYDYKRLRRITDGLLDLVESGKSYVAGDIPPLYQGHIIVRAARNAFRELEFLIPNLKNGDSDISQKIKDYLELNEGNIISVEERDIADDNRTKINLKLFVTTEYGHMVDGLVNLVNKALGGQEDNINNTILDAARSAYNALEMAQYASNLDELKLALGWVTQDSNNYKELMGDFQDINIHSFFELGEQSQNEKFQDLSEIVDEKFKLIEQDNENAFNNAYMNFLMGDIFNASPPSEVKTKIISEFQKYMINKEYSFNYLKIINDNPGSKDHVISIYKLINLHIFLKEIDFLHYEKLFISTKINTCKELFAQNLNDFAGIKILEEEKEILKKKIHDEEILVLFKAADKISAKTGTGLLTCIGKGKNLLECITREIEVTDSDCISYNEKMRNYGKEMHDLIKEDHINAHGEIITEEDNKARNKIRAEFQDSEIKFYDDKYNLVQTYNKYKNIEDANTAVYDTAGALNYTAASADFLRPGRRNPDQNGLIDNLKYAYEYSRDLDVMHVADADNARDPIYRDAVREIALIETAVIANPEHRDFGPRDTDVNYKTLGKLTKKLKSLKEARGNDDTVKPLLRAAKDSVTAAAIIVKKRRGLLLDTNPAKALKAAVTRAQNLKRELRRVNSSVTDDFTYPGFLQYNMEKVTTMKELFKKNINKNCLEYEYCNYIKLKFWNKSGKSGNHETYYHENCKKLIDGINFYMV